MTIQYNFNITVWKFDKVEFKKRRESEKDNYLPIPSLHVSRLTVYDNRQIQADLDQHTDANRTLKDAHMKNGKEGPEH